MIATQTARDVWEKHDGRFVRVDGLFCILRVTTRSAIYPYPHKVLDVSACPVGAAKRTATYRRIRAELGDDWSTDILESDIEVQCEILDQLEQ